MLFSIIIPAKNEEKNIGKCLDSINAMDFEPERFEVLVIDNGSSDRTVEIAGTKGAGVYKEPELTISGLRNFGASKAVGEILAFLDADCTVDKNWLRAASAYLEKADVVSFGSPAILPDVTTWVQRTWFNIRGKKNLVEDVDWLESANVFVKRNEFQSAGGFNEELITCEDFDLSYRLKKLGRLISDCRIIAVHHREPSTVVQFFNKERWRGKSNFSGIFSHGFRWRELPSLVVPPLYLFTALLVFGYLILGMLGMVPAPVSGFVALLILWQAPILMLAIMKVHHCRDPLLIFQLYTLLNVYFFARGVAVFRKS